MIKKLYLFATLFISVSVFAQDKLPKQFVSVGFGFGKTGQFQLASMPIVYNHSLFNTESFRYVIGVRQNLGFGQREFTINSKKAIIDDLSNYSFNVMAGLEFITPQQILVGFNVDLIGATFGTRSYKTVGNDPIYYITPEHFNLIGVGENSTGSLVNEFYLGYMFKKGIAVRGGVTFYSTAINYKSNKLENTAIIGSVIPYIQIQYTLWSKGE